MRAAIGQRRSLRRCAAVVGLSRRVVGRRFLSVALMRLVTLASEPTP